MPLLDTDDLPIRFRELVENSRRIYLAVAWITACDEFEILRAAAEDGKHVQAIVGLAGNATRPEALKSLAEVASVRIGEGQPRTFHPKFYLFDLSRERIAWIGSPNLTSGGFGLNRELVHEFVDDDGAALNWFARAWAKYDGDTPSQIDEYCSNWTPPPPRGRPPRGRSSPVHSRIELLQPAPNSWPEYVEALRKCDEFLVRKGWGFSVLDERWSYVETITTGRDLTRRRSWSDLTHAECQILLGTSSRTGAWGLLGSMNNARLGVSIFQRSPRVRERIRQALELVIEVSGDDRFISQASRFIRTVRDMAHFSSGIATRLLALARPDRAISVNGGSSTSLHALTGLSSNAQVLGAPESYVELLEWLYELRWYQSPEPQDATAALWRMRAALLDSFVYERP
jgi:hypothetical protein